MQNGSNDHLARIRRARWRAATVSHLGWDERVLLAAAEAADACVGGPARAEVACVIADKVGVVLDDADTVRTVRLAIAEAMASAGLATEVPAHAVLRLAWRLVFDLWGGPDR